MKGFIIKKHFFRVLRAFGIRIAIKFLFSKETTFLRFLNKNNLI